MDPMAAMAGAKLALPLLQRLLKGGKLNEMFGAEGAGLLGETLGDSQIQNPEESLLGALVLLSKQMPKEQEEAHRFLKALSQTLEGLAALRTLGAQE